MKSHSQIADYVQLSSRAERGIHVLLGRDRNLGSSPPSLFGMAKDGAASNC